MSSLRLEGVSVLFPREARLLPGGDSSTPRLTDAPLDALARLKAADDEETARRNSAAEMLAVDAVDLAVPDGETLALIGPSGCGKSSLLRVVAGLQQVSAGHVFFDDQDVTHLDPKDRGIGMVFQNYALYPHMESKANLGFFFRMHRREEEIDERVRETAAILGVGFSELLDRRPKTLSGGQQQRVAIGRCIVRNPRIFLFDEPLSNLDAKLRAITRTEIKRLLRRFKVTTLYVTHDQIEAIALGDRVAVMRGGRIEQIGTYRDVYDRPRNVFVGSFLGSPAMSFLPGVLRDDRQSVAIGDSWLSLEGQPAHAPVGASVVIGARPEHVRLAEDEPGALVGRVEVIEPMFAERQLLVTFDVQGQRCTARLPQDQPLARGDLVPLTIEPASIRVFDAQSGEALL